MRRRKGPNRKAFIDVGKRPTLPPRPKRKRVRNRVCPVHGTQLVHLHGRHGLYWVCPEPGCDVRCSGGRTSTPCDQRTANERTRTHEMFDPLWRGHARKFRKRDGAYEWLQRAMGLDEKDCHIGYFDIEQCRTAQDKIREFLKRN